MNRIQRFFTYAALTLCAVPAMAAFDDCKFNFGRQWSNQFNASTSFSGQGLSHIAIWLGDNASYNQYWEGDMVKAAKNNGLTPVIYAYVIAEYGKDNGLKDCDVGSPNHCTGGANMIRNNWSQILARYKSYAQGIAGDFGSGTTIWLIEPDMLQYSVTGDQLNTKYAQSGGGIPDADMGGKYFNEIVAAIKQYLPNAKIAVDISPWLNSGITKWYGNFDKSKVDYLFTSGGRTQGNASLIRSDNNNTVTWASASAAMGGKKIIADDGYGVGGASNSDYQDWMSLSNINARISDGVIGITIQEPNSSFTSFANSNKNISTGCGTQPSSSSQKSSSSVQSSSSQKSSSSVKSSSSQKSSSSVKSSSSQKSSSSGTVASPDWKAENAQLSNESNSEVSIGSANDWNSERVVTRTLGTVESGTTYTLSFDADVSRGGASMDVALALGSYCKETKTISSKDITPVSCEFTANKTESVVLKITVPAMRWETLSITNLKLVGPNGNIIGGTTSVLPLAFQTYSLELRAKNGRSVQWQVPQGAHLQVFDLFGNKIQSVKASAQLDLSVLPAGLYVVRAQKGLWSATQRVDNF